MRIYHLPNAQTRIILFLPPYKDKDSSSPAPQNPNWPQFGPNHLPIPSDAEPDCYELEMINDSVENHVVVAERPKDASSSSLSDSKDGILYQISTLAMTFLSEKTS